jgi:arylsulfatase A-like enzyme
VKQAGRIPWLAAALIWAAAYALVLCTVRLVVQAVFGAGASYLKMPGHLLEGAALGLPLLRYRRAAWAVFPVLLAVLFVTGILFYYEAFLGELPGALVIGEYLGQLEHIGSSLKTGAAPWWLAGEIVLPSVGLLVLFLVLRRKAGDAGRTGAILTGCLLASCLAWTAAVHVKPDLLGSRQMWSARLPLVVLVAGAFGRIQPAAGDVPDGGYGELQKLSGLEPFASGERSGPLCSREPSRARRGENGRSVILLVVESVGRRELEARPDGALLLPNLHRIASESFSAGNFYAVGTQTCQALPALFSGQHAQPWDVLFWRTPLPRFDGLPRALRDAGYSTAYFHGAGLSFEQKRAYLRMAGFDELHELREEDPSPRYGWGLSDGEMFGRTRAWIETHRKEDPDAPYLMTFATLSGHHPFEVPDDWPRRFGRSQRDLFYETLAYMDAQLGPFYDWYVEHERPRGTYLVLVSDHSPLLLNTEAIAAGRPLRFDSVFIVHGPDDAEQAAWEPLEQRLASQMDVPATLGGLVGVHPGPCDQGLDLLGNSWPADRVIAGVGGRGLNEVYLWSGAVHARYERRQEVLTVLDADGAYDASLARMRRFLDLLLPITRLVMESNAYAPPAAGSAG